MIDYTLLEKYCDQISVLFVEDDEDLIKEMGLLLKDIFKEVDIQIDGTSGLNKYNKFFEETSKYYDLIITDIQMPNMSGVDLIKNIYLINPEQKVIVLSAHSESNYLMELVNIGIEKFLLKPIDYNSFLNEIFDITKNIYESKEIQNAKEAILIKLADEFYWNKIDKVLVYNEKNINLTKKEFLFIDLLMKYPERIYTNEEIVNYLWIDKNDLQGNILNLKNLISRFRKKVPLLDIQNNYGFGYSIKLSK